MMTKTTPAVMVVAQACLRTIDSTMSEMSSTVLRAASIAWMMSFHFRTSSASYSPLNRRASAAVVDGVALALELVDGVEERRRALHRSEPAHEPTVWSRHLHQQVGLLLELGQDLFDRRRAGGGRTTASMSSTTSSSSSASAWMSSRSNGVTKLVSSRWRIVAW